MVFSPLVKILCGQSNKFHEKSSWENDLWTIWSGQKNFFGQKMHLADFKQILNFDFQDFHLIFTLPKLRWQSLRKIGNFFKKNNWKIFQKKKKNDISAERKRWEIWQKVQNESCSELNTCFREKTIFEKFPKFRPQNRLSFEVTFFSPSQNLVIFVKIAKIDKKSHLEWKYD